MTPANSHALRDCAQKFQFCPLWASVRQDGTDSCSITHVPHWRFSPDPAIIFRRHV